MVGIMDTITIAYLFYVMGKLGIKHGVKELSSTGAANLGRALLAEFIGCFIVNFVGCASSVNIDGPSTGPNIVRTALCVGFAVFVVISTINHMSGGHINPSVTIALFSIGRVSLARSILYVLAQCAGSACGPALVKGLTPGRVVGNLAITTLGKDVSAMQGFAVEFFITFALLFVVCGVIDPRKPEFKMFAPFAIGVMVAVGHLCVMDYTGASMNPARSFATAVVAGVWTDHWIYWAGPLAGAVVASLTYEHLLSMPLDNTEKSSLQNDVFTNDQELSESSALKQINVPTGP